MVNNFANALISERKHDIIPEEYDCFAPFIGEWDFKWHDNIGTKNESINKGKWTFSRVLEGRGVQDTFITSRINSCTGELEREYGTTIRIYNPLKKNWDIFYGCTGEAIQLVANKEDDKIVLTCITPVGFLMKWIFFDIQDNAFKWKNIRSVDNGKTWTTKARAEEVCRNL
jgi:hypothetical protein